MFAPERAALDATVSTPLTLPTDTAPGGALLESMAKESAPFPTGTSSGKRTSSESEGDSEKGGTAKLVGITIAPTASEMGSCVAFTIATASVSVIVPRGYSSSTTV
jgi:hypothetical protein